MKYIPNLLTLLRILASLLIVIAADQFFFLLYFLAGITDILDGWIARKMNWTSRLGTLLDSLADLIFFIVVATKVIFTIKLPNFLLWGIFMIALIRCLTYLIGYFRFRQFASLHSYLNKLTGLLLFLAPLILLLVPVKPFSIILLVCSALSAIEELLIVSTTKKLDKNVTTFRKK
ncbi:CDP-alcohol phosphatidyltransferase family protein [Enterococcus pingfangensis]|uniref:CDP-alcohol phosphatidyltransferase family protein n=1 Tax=Enterococcus pingfangensis TaxID=2559924 RepID=UPI0010F45530|nr:CDP-alcohol phosphatidyltransferase family protein [Enterococcus pingfangensis]